MINESIWTTYTSNWLSLGNGPVNWRIGRLRFNDLILTIWLNKRTSSIFIIATYLHNLQVFSVLETYTQNRDWKTITAFELESYCNRYGEILPHEIITNFVCGLFHPWTLRFWETPYACMQGIRANPFSQSRPLSSCLPLHLCVLTIDVVNHGPQSSFLVFFMLGKLTPWPKLARSSPYATNKAFLPRVSFPRFFLC